MSDQVADTVTVDNEPVSSETFKDHFSEKIAEEPGGDYGAVDLLKSFLDWSKSRDKTDLSNHVYNMIIKVKYGYKYSKKYHCNRVTTCSITCGEKLIGFGRVCWYPEDEYDSRIGNRNAFIKALKTIDPKEFVHMLSDAYFSGSTLSKKKSK